MSRSTIMTSRLPHRLAAVAPLIAKHGGVYLVRAGKVAIKERVAAQAFYGSAEYQAIIGLRIKSASSRFSLVEGLKRD